MRRAGVWNEGKDERVMCHFLFSNTINHIRSTRSSFLSFARDGQAGTPRMIMGPVSKNEMNRLTALSPFHFLSDYSFYYRSCSTKKIMDKPFNHKDWNSLVIRILG